MHAYIRTSDGWNVKQRKVAYEAALHKMRYLYTEASGITTERT
jgi:hypothetical protein